MIVEERLIGTITPYHKNPRIISAAALDAIAASIKEFGFRQPIVVDETASSSSDMDATGRRSNSAWKKCPSMCPWDGHRPRSRPTA